MAKEKNIFKRLSNLFAAGNPKIRHKTTNVDTTVAVAGQMSSAALLFQKSIAPTYATITSNAYNISERLMRYQDYHSMEYTAEIGTCLDIYADEIASQDDKGKTLFIFSENRKIQQELQHLFYDVLNIEFNLRPWARNLVKFGDLFLLNDVHPQQGVVNVFPIPVNEIEREENYDPENPFAVRFRWSANGNRTLEGWEISHFRLLGNDIFLPYGTSVIEAARRIWRQLILIEDAMLVYRVERAPERRVFYIDVANMPANDIPAYMEEQKRQLRNSPVVDNQTGRVDLRYNPMSVGEDYFIPVRGGSSGTKIETLPGGSNAGTVEDVEYLQNKLFSALKIPKPYLGFADGLSSKATLAQIDIRFSRTVSAIQRTIISELNKLAIIHLFVKGYDGDDLSNFELRIPNPSTVAEQQKLELWRTRFDIAGSTPEGLGSQRFIYKTIWGLTDEQIEQLQREQLREATIKSTLEKAAGGELETFTGGGGGGGGGGGPTPTGDIGGGAEGGDDDIFGDAEDVSDETPTEEPENASDFDEDDDFKLLTASEDFDEDNDIPVPSLNPDKPIKVSPQLKRVLYNKSRRRTHGASKTHMPDFAKMLSYKDENDPQVDPFDSAWLRGAVTNPLGESYRTPVSPDVLNLLGTLIRSGKVKRASINQGGLLNESIVNVSNKVDVQDEINAINDEIGIDITDYEESMLNTGDENE